MPEKFKCRRSLLRHAIVALFVGLTGFTYRASYYRTTTLIIDTSKLDWYAYREFSSPVQFYFFLPMFYIESHYDRSNPGYVLQSRIARKA